MRRVHQAYDDDELYDDYDDYYDEEEDEEEAALAAQLMAEYSHGNRDNRQAEAAAVLQPPPPQKPQQPQQPKQHAKPGKSPTKSKEELAEEAGKVMQIDQLVPGMGNEVIRSALRAAGGNVEVAVDQLLSAPPPAPATAAAAAPKATAAKPKHVVLSIGGESAAKAGKAAKAGSKADKVAKATKATKKEEKSNNKPQVDNSKPAGQKAAAAETAKTAGDEAAEAVQAVHIEDRGSPAVDYKEGEELEAIGDKPNINLVVVGHVDAGKSTLMGHLLYKLKFVSQREMHKFEKESKEIGKASFAFAWVMDEEEEERERGVTVDVGVKYFETEHRNVTLLDAPGHRDFIPNMISGAVQGDVAILVVPGNAGEFESSFQHNGQTKEHAVLVRYCGIRRLVVAVNKMDMCEWDKGRFDEVVGQLREFLIRHGYAEEDLVFVPVSGLEGLNLVDPLPEGTAPWYTGPSLSGCIDSMKPVGRPRDKPLRMVVAEVFKTMVLGPLTTSGKIEAGVIREGQSVLVAPGNQLAKVKAIQRHRGKEAKPAKAGYAGENVEVGLTGIEHNMVGTSSVLCDPKHPVPVASRFTAEIATLEALQTPILSGTKVSLHTQGFNVPATVSRLLSVKQEAGKDPKRNPRFLRKNQSAVVEITTALPICVERFADYRPLSRVMLRQNGVTVAAGHVTEL